MGYEEAMRLEIEEFIDENTALRAQLTGKTTAEAIKMAFDNGGSYLESVMVRAEQAEADRDALAARVAEWEEWFGCSSPHDTEAAKATIPGKEQARANRLAARVAELEGHVELLRESIEDAPDAIDSPMNGDAARDLKQYFRPLLARTPAQSLAKVQAEALSAMAKTICEGTEHPVALAVVHLIQAEASRLEAEAANG